MRKIILIERQVILRFKNKFSSMHYLYADTDSGVSQLANPVGKRAYSKVTRGLAIITTVLVFLNSSFVCNQFFKNKRI